MTRHAIQTKTAKKARRWLFVAVFLISMKMVMEVIRMPDFQGSGITVDHSPDGAYKSLLVILPNSWLNREKGLSDVVFDSGYKRWNILMDAKSEEILGFYSFDEDWATSGGVWICQDDNSNCKRRYFGYEEDGTDLPPSLWKRIHAKLFTLFRGFDLAEINPRYIHCLDPPIHPPIQAICPKAPLPQPF